MNKVPFVTKEKLDEIVKEFYRHRFTCTMKGEFVKM